MEATNYRDILDKVRTAKEKQASEPVEVLQRAATQGIKQEALSDIGNVAMWSLGAGAASRGAQGLYNLLRRNVAPPEASRPDVAPLPLPYPVEDDKEKAAEADSWLGSPVTRKEGLWWRKPGMLLGGLAAGYGGWKIVDSILDNRRKKEMEDDLQSTKNKFQQALLSQYDSPIKQAAEVSELGRDLDKLYDTFEKLAAEGTLGDWVGENVAGNYATYALPASLLAGYAAYKSARKRSKRSILDKALLQRARQRQASRPAGLFAIPTPASQPSPGIDEEDKYAA